ncbi:fasciclin domain-containing protein [Actinomadura barringtoniae]|uniref:Fasciclin domain-containing protein n=1 Tax=Actinomadura barringtoniae TaxID=1427535 RepID=A0A939T6K0_9ACTN|nr:fasciclin domain-containing protein [Actinomadura barringtoniae]MBO2450924.1 fasciclin domain-containing protein [Actinomadura barringtoniae]
MNRIYTTAIIVSALAFGATACSGDDSKSDSSSGGKAAATMPSSSAPAAAAADAKPFGPACSAVPASGKGSFSGMAADPVATAASNNPVLSTLVTAVKKAGLVDTLNSAQNITVFAPTNDAFAKIPKADLDKVLADKKKLTDILTYHVVGQKVAPNALAMGDFKTLEGGMVKTSGSGESFMANDAKVVCGNVQTANATVYIVDTVLMPKS